MTPADRTSLARAWAVALTVLSFFPFANWIRGGHGAPWYAVSASEWLSGSAISIGSAFVLFILLRRFDWWPGGWNRIADTAARHTALAGALLGTLSVCLCSVVALQVLSGRPLHIDEIAQVMQARILAEGSVSRPADLYPEFFSALQVVDTNGSVFSQFPPGGPLMLVPGVLVGVSWLAGPVFGAIAVVAFWQLVRRTEESAAVALGAAALFALAPFMVFMAGSHMNHVPTLAWLCLALVGLWKVTNADSARASTALLTGLCLGMIASIRPLDGAAFALPAGVWLLARTVRGRSPMRNLVAAAVGVAIPMVAVLAYNRATTGDALLFGYELLWGASHGLGFHQAPWGISHTPARGVELINLYFLRLQTYLFETPLPSLVPAIAALALVRRLSAFDRYLLVSSALLVLGYFAYWHDGFFLGPRFVYLLLPALVLWTARLPGIVGERFPARWGANRFVLLTYAVSAAVAVLISLPVRVRQYATGLSSMRLDYVAPARTAGVEGALIFVRESWGAQLIARLWGLGVSRSDAEVLYRSVDSCLLDRAIDSLEIAGRRGADAVAHLRPLTRDSLRLVASTLSPDGTERVLPGAMYPDVCQRRVLEDRGGYTFFAPVLTHDVGTNIYARDLHARDTLLLQRHAARAVFLLRAASAEAGAPLVLERLRMDSARAEWSSAMVR